LSGRGLPAGGMRPPRSLRTAFSQVSASSGMLSGSGCRRRRRRPSPGCYGTCCSTYRGAPISRRRRCRPSLGPCPRWAARLWPAAGAGLEVAFVAAGCRAVRRPAACAITQRHARQGDGEYQSVAPGSHAAVRHFSADSRYNLSYTRQFSRDWTGRATPLAHRFAHRWWRCHGVVRFA
jgi:hypothetical protein